jgi:EmrB/QacA subfamily drug resistance transporter
MADSRPQRALAVCLVAAFMAGLDVSIVNVALPSIQRGLGATTDSLQWIISGYALSFGLVLVPGGRLGDARSRRAMFMLGVALFTAASAVCGLAPSVGVLIGARVAQGFAAGLLNPQVSGLIQQLFQGPSRGRAFGWFGATMGVSTAAGPVIGGALVTAFGPEHGWRWVFLVNLPIGLVLLPVARRVLPPPEGVRKRQESMDPVGVLLLGSGAALLLLPFIQVQQWPGPQKWLLVPVALGLLAAFVWWERHYPREPLVSLALFEKRSYTLGSTLGLFYFAGFTGIFFIYTIYLQIGHGYSALTAGLSIMPFALGSAASAVVGGRLVTTVGRRLTAAGLIVVMAGLLLTILALWLVPGEYVGLATALPLLVGGIGSGLVIAPNQALTLSEVPPAKGGSAAGMLQTGQRLGSAMGVATAGSAFFGTLRLGWSAAITFGFAVVVAFIAAALAAALYDVWRGPTG